MFGESTYTTYPGTGSTVADYTGGSTACATAAAASSQSWLCSDTCNGRPTAQTVSIPAYASTSKASWQWKVKFNECAVGSQLYNPNPGTANGDYWYYHDLFLNSDTTNSGTTDKIVQMGQVRFRCNLKAFQEDDAGNVVITEDTMVADDDFTLRLYDYLQ